LFSQFSFPTRTLRGSEILCCVKRGKVKLWVLILGLRGNAVGFVCVLLCLAKVSGDSGLRLVRHALTLHPVFPSGNTYFSHTTATARNATASRAKRILADGERSPFRMRETVLFATPARLASSLLPVFVFRIARLIAAIRLSSSAMSRRCHAETLLTSGNRAGSLAPSFRAESRSPAIVETAVVNRRRVGSSGTAKPHGAAGSLNHGAIMGSRKPYGSPLGFGLVVQIINGANFSNS